MSVPSTTTTNAINTAATEVGSGSTPPSKPKIKTTTSNNSHHPSVETSPFLVYPSPEELRPPLSLIVLHAAIYLLRGSALCALVTLVLVRPFYYYWYLPSALVQALGPAAFFIVTIQLLSHALPWFFFNSIFMTFDALHADFGFCPSWRRFRALRWLGDAVGAYKLPRQRAQIPPLSLVKRTILTAVVSHLVFMPAAMWLLMRYGCIAVARLPPRDAPIHGFSEADIAAYLSLRHVRRGVGSFLTLMLHFLLANAFNEFFFFLVHGLMHYNTILYRLFHKQHHTYTGTVSIAAEHATLAEQVLANTIPSIGYVLFFFLRGDGGDQAAAEPPVLHYLSTTVRSWPVFMVWIWARLAETYETHSGYCFAETTLGKMGLFHGHRARFHDFHHTHNVGNFGAGLFMDALCQTMDPYLRYRFAQKAQEKNERLRASEGKVGERVWELLEREKNKKQ